MTRELPERWTFDDLSKADMQALLTGALDEVYALRMLMAMNAVVTEATLDYKSFPKTRRGFTEHQVAVMRAAASGDHKAAYVEAHQQRGPQVLEEVAGDSCMTNGQWVLDHIDLLSARDERAEGGGVMHENANHSRAIGVDAPLITAPRHGRQKQGREVGGAVAEGAVRSAEMFGPLLAGTLVVNAIACFLRRNSGGRS